MTKTHKNFILLFILIIAILLFFLKKYNDILEQDQIDILVSKNVEIINNEIFNQKQHALSLAILFSKNQNIITLLKNNQRKKLKKELNNLLQIISNYANIKNIQIQVHTKDLKVFVRNWEDKDTGLNLKSFRKGLVKVKQTKQPYVSNELGKRLNIKAISPVFDEKKKYIGSIEVIMDYSELQKRLQLVGIESLALLDAKFLNIAKYHKNNKKLHQYVVITSKYDQKIYDLLRHNPDTLSFNKFYYTMDDKLITAVPIGDVHGSTPGYIVAVFDKQKQDFNYLPRYEYLGEIMTNIDHPAPSNNVHHDKKILIK